MVLENIRRVAATAGPRRRPALAIWFLATRENVAELPDVVDLVRGLGLSELHTQGVHYWGDPGWQPGARQANAIDDLRDVLIRTREAAARAGVRFQWHNFPQKGAARECRWPWRGAYVTADGYVTPCCENGSNPDRINFGNVLVQSFDEIWTSPAYQQFRRELKSTSGRPSICVDCPSYERNVRLPR
jgi:radical SAM protein with 4Fe4S-binding SPASM domain